MEDQNIDDDDAAGIINNNNFNHKKIYCYDSYSIHLAFSNRW
jgi:hypothetical protein